MAYLLHNFYPQQYVPHHHSMHYSYHHQGYENAAHYYEQYHHHQYYEAAPPVISGIQSSSDYLARQQNPFLSLTLPTSIPETEEENLEIIFKIRWFVNAINLLQYIVNRSSSSSLSSSFIDKKSFFVMLDSPTGELVQKFPQKKEEMYSFFLKYEFLQVVENSDNNNNNNNNNTTSREQLMKVTIAERDLADFIFIVDLLPKDGSSLAWSDIAPGLRSFDVIKVLRPLVEEFRVLAFGVDPTTNQTVICGSDLYLESLPVKFNPSTSSSIQHQQDVVVEQQQEDMMMNAALEAGLTEDELAWRPDLNIYHFFDLVRPLLSTKTPVPIDDIERHVKAINNAYSLRGFLRHADLAQWAVSTLQKLDSIEHLEGPIVFRVKKKRWILNAKRVAPEYMPRTERFECDLRQVLGHLPLRKATIFRVLKEQFGYNKLVDADAVLEQYWNIYYHHDYYYGAEYHLPFYLVALNLKLSQNRAGIEAHDDDPYIALVDDSRRFYLRFAYKTNPIIRTESNRINQKNEDKATHQAPQKEQEEKQQQQQKPKEVVAMQRQKITNHEQKREKFFKSCGNDDDDDDDEDLKQESSSDNNRLIDDAEDEDHDENNLEECDEDQEEEEEQLVDESMLECNPTCVQEEEFIHIDEADVAAVAVVFEVSREVAMEKLKLARGDKKRAGELILEESNEQ